MKSYFLNARELRAPMVQSMRAIGPRDPDLVVNALVDYPVIWNWLLTAVTLSLLFGHLCHLLQTMIVCNLNSPITESICACLWHVPGHRHLPSERALAQSLLGIFNKMKFSSVFDPDVLRSSRWQTLCTPLPSSSQHCSSTSLQAPLQSSLTTKR